MPDALTYVVVRPFTFSEAEFKVGDVLDPKDASAISGSRPDLLRFCRVAGAPLGIPVARDATPASKPASAFASNAPANAEEK